MIDKVLVKHLCKGTYIVSPTLSRSTIATVGQWSVPPFEEISYQLYPTYEGQNKQSNTILDQINDLLQKLKRCLAEKPELKACFDYWFEWTDAKNPPKSANIVNEKKRKLSSLNVAGKNNLQPSPSAKCKKFRKEIKASEISKKAAAERESIFEYLQDYVDIIINGPTAPEPKLPCTLSESEIFKKKSRPTIDDGDAIKKSSMKHISKNLASTSSVADDQPLKNCSSELSLKKRTAPSSKLSGKISIATSPLKRQKLFNKRPSMSPLKPFSPTNKKLSSANDIARNLLKKSSNYRKPEKINRPRPIDQRQRSNSVDELVDRRMQEKRSNLKIACQLACKMLCESNVITVARSNGPEHPLSQAFYQDRMWRNLTKFCSKQVPIYKFDDEREYLKNLTAKISKSARQNGVVTYGSLPLSPSTEMNVPPRFPLNIRKPYRQYDKLFEDDRKKITSDGENFNEEIFKKTFNRKMRESFYDTEIECKRYNIDDRQMGSFNVEAVFLFRPDSPFGDICSTRRDMFGRRQMVVNNIQTKILLQEIKQNFEERGKRPRRTFKYKNLIETISIVGVDSDSVSSTSSSNGGGVPSISPPNELCEPPSYFLPANPLTVIGRESPSEVLPEELLTIQMAPDRHQQNSWFERRPLLLAPYYPPFPMR